MGELGGRWEQVEVDEWPAQYKCSQSSHRWHKNTTATDNRTHDSLCPGLDRFFRNSTPFSCFVTRRFLSGNAKIIMTMQTI